MSRRARTLCIVFAMGGLGIPGRVAAQECPGGRTAVSAYWENDLPLLSLWIGTDEAYTNGVRLDVARSLSGEDSGLLGTRWPFAANDSSWCLSYNLAVSHLLYTPRQLETPVLQRDDRPYGAWFYVTYQLTRSEASSEPRTADAIAIDVGLLGPGAGGGWLQDRVHKRFGIDSKVGQPYKKPLGWHHQLRNEGTINIRVLRQRRVRADDDGVRNWDVIWHGGAAAGNVFTWALGGATARLGWNVPNDLGPIRIPAPPPPPAVTAVPSTLAPASAAPGGTSAGPTTARQETEEPRARSDADGVRRGFVYGFLSTEGRLVLRNAFLDGNLFSTDRLDFPSIQKTPIVADLSWGIVAAYKAVRVTYHNVYRTSEFKTPFGARVGSVNNHGHGFGSLSLTVGRLF